MHCRKSILNFFGYELGCLQGVKVKLNVDGDATPKFFKARTVPLSLKEKVETELENLESMGIISPVETSRWAAPIVPVLKQNSALRICGDYKVSQPSLPHRLLPTATSGRITR